MLKGKISTLCLLWMVLASCLYLTLPANADNSCPLPISTGSGNALFPENWRDICLGSTIDWDDPGSADIIARNSSCAIAVTDPLGKGKPYYWSVSGTGFSLANAITTTTSNTLRANGTACGSATINVIACNGNIITTGYVRCTTGRWVLTSTCQTQAVCIMYWCTCTQYETKYKYVSTYCPGAGYGSYCSDCSKGGTCGAYAGGGYCETNQYCYRRYIYEWQC